MKAISFSGSVLLLAASASADLSLNDRARIRTEMQAAAVSEEVELQAAAAEELAAIAKFIVAGDDKREKQKKDKKKEEKDKSKKSKDKSTKKSKDKSTKKSEKSKDKSSTSADTKREKQKKEKKKEESSTKKSKDKSSSSTKKTKKSKDKSSTSSTKNSRDSKDCIDDKEPNSHRDGAKYKFKLYEKDAQCTDKDDELYEYGQFDDVREFSDCADACVKDVVYDLLDDFRGFDWDCDKERCRCLYDKDTLDSDNDFMFDKTDKDHDGKGHIKGGKDKDKWYCAKLEDSEGFHVPVESERALRGRV